MAGYYLVSRSEDDIPVGEPDPPPLGLDGPPGCDAPRLAPRLLGADGRPGFAELLLLDASLNFCESPLAGLDAGVPPRVDEVEPCAELLVEFTGMTNSLF